AANPGPRLSGDARFLVSEATSRAAAGSRVIVLRDRWTRTSRTIERPGQPVVGRCRNATISADGRTVVFTSGSTNVTDGPDANAAGDDVYRFDIPSVTLSRISVATDGHQPSAGSS